MVESCPGFSAPWPMRTVIEAVLCLICTRPNDSGWRWAGGVGGRPVAFDGCSKTGATITPRESPNEIRSAGGPEPDELKYWSSNF